MKLWRIDQNRTCQDILSWKLKIVKMWEIKVMILIKTNACWAVKEIRNNQLTII